MSKNVTKWLSRTPQPAAVLALVGDVERRIEATGGGRQWRDMTRTIEALNPSKLTAIDRAGNVLRCMDLAVAPEDDEKPSAEGPSEIEVFAKLIADAYDKGGKSYEPLLNNAMTFIDRQGARIAKQDAEIERLRLVIHKLNGQLLEMSAEPAAEEPSVLEQMLAGAAAAKAQEGPVRAVPKPKEGVK